MYIVHNHPININYQLSDPCAEGKQHYSNTEHTLSGWIINIAKYLVEANGCDRTIINKLLHKPPPYKKKKQQTKTETNKIYNTDTYQ